MLHTDHSGIWHCCDCLPPPLPPPSAVYPDGLPFSSDFSDLVGNRSALYRTQNELLNCTNLSTAALRDNNFTVTWSKDSESVGSDNQLMTDASGFYCCQVNAQMPMEAVLTVCATIVIIGECHLTKQTLLVCTSKTIQFSAITMRHNSLLTPADRNERIDVHTYELLAVTWYSLSNTTL